MGRWKDSGREGEGIGVEGKIGRRGNGKLIVRGCSRAWYRTILDYMGFIQLYSYVIINYDKKLLNYINFYQYICRINVKVWGQNMF